jgi:hypothetical protein
LDRPKTAIFQERAHHSRRQIKPRVPGAPPIATESAAESVLVRREADAIWLPFVDLIWPVKMTMSLARITTPNAACPTVGVTVEVLTTANATG